MQNCFVFFDTDLQLVETYRRVLKDLPPGAEKMVLNFERTDCRKLVRTHDIDIMVSPANSTGYMDGGIDLYFMRMFPGIQRTVQRVIRTYNILDGPLYVLPVGSAVKVGTNQEICPELICAPTMPRPCDIRDHPENVRRCMYGILKCLGKTRLHCVAVPGLGTGCGRLSPEESARQIRLGIEDFASGADIGNDVLLENPGEYVLRLAPRQ